ncbi:AMP-binding protein [Variovorax guangxiensis]|uniref:AMP-binding protein n=1 Tax=Variovorax guangxiensis TaxID=1775474 RepID=UPI0028611339|nr:AMP-binding protein [Variovorax guangxiensis]MDR6861146.1 fatty-acyl-CoA synthase [Variovorax guangxiensis]
MTAALSPQTLSTMLLNALDQHPDSVAFVWDGGQMSYRAASERIGRMQAVFSAAGLARGARIGVLAGNSVDAWCASAAAQASGMATTALQPMSSLEDQLFQLEDFGAEVLVADAAAFGERASVLGQRCAGLKQTYTLAAAGFGIDLAVAADHAGHATMRDLSSPWDMALLQYTGGTTGRAKGAVRSQAGYAAMIQQTSAGFDLPVRPKYLAAAPITHVAGSLVVPTLMRGGTVRLMSSFNPARVLELIAAERINLTLLVPTMIYTLLDAPELARADLSSLESVIYGASPMSPSRLVEGLERIGPVFAQLYGQTEGFPITFLRREDHDPRRAHLFASCGNATPGATVAVLDDEDRPVPVGEVGELCVRGPQVMQGYHNQPELTDAALRNGWLHTGDMARADDQGYYFIVDRKKDMIVSGGFNVYPRDVEDVISSHPAVAMVAVIGVPDAKWGEAVTAVVQCRTGVASDSATLARELTSMVREKKGSVLTPKHFEFVQEMPRTAVGKIDKKVLRQAYWADQDRQVA